MNVTSETTWLKRLPSPLYKAAAQAWIDRTFPRHLFIETTASCNLSCAYCPREDQSHHMDFSLFTSVVEEISRHGSRSISLHLFGEPTLYPYWMDAIRTCKRQSHTVLLTTNGTTLNRRVDDLVAANPDLVLWSWRPEVTFTPETKSKLRQWGKFRVRFISDITPEVAYAEWADWPNVEHRRLHNYGGDIAIDEFKTPSTEGGFGSATAVTRWPCYHLWLAPAIAWNGELLICCADPHHKEVLGRFPDMSLQQMWTGDRLTRIRKSHLSGEYGGICGGCDVWKQYPDLFFKWQKRSSS